MTATDITLYAVCESCGHVQPYPARDVHDEESAPWKCEHCNVDDLDIGYDHGEALTRSEIIVSRNAR
jgi:hypothetical protein